MPYLYTCTTHTREWVGECTTHTCAHPLKPVHTSTHSTWVKVWTGVGRGLIVIYTHWFMALLIDWLIDWSISHSSIIYRMKSVLYNICTCCLILIRLSAYLLWYFIGHCILWFTLRLMDDSEFCISYCGIVGQARRLAASSLYIHLGRPASSL